MALKILVIKMSSLGDVVHCLPAITDLKKHHSDVEIHWVVEEGFADIVRLHPLVQKVFPIALRRWRKNKLKTWISGELKAFKRLLRAEKYDYIIDAQGLLKSAVVARWARGKRYGLSFKSARESIAASFYHARFEVSWQQHAVNRCRDLFAQVFNYTLSDIEDPNQVDYGYPAVNHAGRKPYVLFLHGTTWDTKKWPIAYWQMLAQQLQDQGIDVKLTWGNQAEREAASAISRTGAEVVPRQALSQVFNLVAHASLVVSVDTGLAHLAAALAVPGVSLYGATNPAKTGTWGKHQTHLKVDYACAPCLSRDCKLPGEHAVMPPCFQSLQPAQVLQSILANL